MTEIANLTGAINVVADFETLKRFQKELIRTGKIFKSLRNHNVVQSLKAASTQLGRVRIDQRSINNTRTTIKVDRRQVTQARKETRGLQKDLAKTTRLVRDLGIVFAGFGIFREAVRANREVEKSLFVLRTALGSQEDAVKGFDETVATAKRLGLALEPLIFGFSQMQAAAMDNNMTVEETKRVFEAVSAQAAITGATADDLKGAFRAVRQMMTKGKVQAEELTGQLGERMVGAIGKMAKGLGIGTQELFKMLETGKLAADVALPALADAIENDLDPEALAARMQTLEAQIANFQTTVTMFFKALGESGFNDFLKNMLAFLAEMLRIASPFFKLVMGFLSAITTPLKIVADLLSTINENLLAIAITFGLIKFGALSKLAGFVKGGGFIGKAAGMAGVGSSGSTFSAAASMGGNAKAGSFLGKFEFLSKFISGLRLASVPLLILGKLLFDFIDLFEGVDFISDIKFLLNRAFPSLNDKLLAVSNAVSKTTEFFKDLFGTNIFLILSNAMLRLISLILSALGFSDSEGNTGVSGGVNQRRRSALTRNIIDQSAQSNLGVGNGGSGSVVIESKFEINNNSPVETAKEVDRVLSGSIRSAARKSQRSR